MHVIKKIIEDKEQSVIRLIKNLELYLTDMISVETINKVLDKLIFIRTYYNSKKNPMPKE